MLQQVATCLVAQLLPGGYSPPLNAVGEPVTSFNVDGAHTLTATVCIICVSCGLWSGLVIGLVTEYYTSHSYTPVREVANSQKTSAATGIIFGLALGYLSCIIPVLCLAVTILVGHTLCGM